MTRIPKEQLKQIREQLLKQVEFLPSEQRNSLESQINFMSDDELEEFLIKNKLISINGENQSPFRLIIEGKMPHFKIAEIDEAIAVLEINPISNGHVIVIPKIPYKINDLPNEIIAFSEVLSNFMKERLGCRKVEIASSEIFGEAIINLIPIYNDENINSKRKKVSNEELKELQKKLSFFNSEEMKNPEKKEKNLKKTRKIPLKKLPKVPKRIP
ncbi:MAG: hypothetical protein QW727_03640 [Candidatus Pacearchaeota archaeon]